MKKTLITLAALAMASVASAAIPTPTHNLTGDLPTNTTLANLSTGYTMVIVLDWDKAITGESPLNNWQGAHYITVGTHNNSNWWGNGISLFKSDSNMSANIRFDGNATMIGLSAGTTDTPDDGVTVTAGTLSSNAFDFVLNKNDHVVNGKVALTFVSTMGTNNQMQGTLYALRSDGGLNAVTASYNGSGWDIANNPYNILGVNNHDSIEHVLFYSNTALTQKQIAEISTASVPEPTTATLSLLALAGLAARRRRK